MAAQDIAPNQDPSDLLTSAVSPGLIALGRRAVQQAHLQKVARLAKFALQQSARAMFLVGQNDLAAAKLIWSAAAAVSLRLDERPRLAADRGRCSRAINKKFVSNATASTQVKCFTPLNILSHPHIQEGGLLAHSGVPTTFLVKDRSPAL